MLHSSEWRKHENDEKLQRTVKCGRFCALYSVRVCMGGGGDVDIMENEQHV